MWIDLDDPIGQLCRRSRDMARAELAKHTKFVKILGSYPNVNG